MNNILLVKLADGMEIIGELMEDNKERMVIGRPLQINYRYFVGGTPSVSFSRYMMFTAEPIVVIDTRHVIAIAPARVAFANFYLDNISDYFGEIEKLVDDELTAALSKSRKDDQMKKLLEMMSTDNATVN